MLKNNIKIDATIFFPLAKDGPVYSMIKEELEEALNHLSLVFKENISKQKRLFEQGPSFWLLV